MLNWQLVIHGENTLSESVVALGNCLRYSISSGDVQVSLEEELKNVRDYIAIQTKINEKQVELYIEAEGVERIWLPKLTLQPLVENVFLHAFVGRDSNNSLAITGRYSGSEKQDYIITVSDNGIGMTEEELRKYCGEPGEIDGEHVGLANVVSRLRYLYRENVTVQAESNYGFGTSITICLKNLKGEEETRDESDHY